MSRFVRDFLPRSKHLLISWLQSPSAVISSHTVVKILRPTTGFPTWGSTKGTENPQGILYKQCWMEIFRDMVFNSQTALFKMFNMCSNRENISIMWSAFQKSNEFHLAVTNYSFNSLIWHLLWEKIKIATSISQNCYYIGITWMMY